MQAGEAAGKEERRVGRGSQEGGKTEGGWSEEGGSREGRRKAGGAKPVSRREGKPCGDGRMGLVKGG